MNLTQLRSDPTRVCFDPTRVSLNQTRVRSDLTRATFNLTRVSSNPTGVRLNPTRAPFNLTRVQGDPEQRATDAAARNNGVPIGHGGCRVTPCRLTRPTQLGHPRSDLRRPRFDLLQSHSNLDHPHSDLGPDEPAQGESSGYRQERWRIDITEKCRVTLR